MEKDHSVQDGPGPVQPVESSPPSAQPDMHSAGTKPRVPFDSDEVHANESRPNEPQPNESRPGSPQQGPSQPATPNPDQPALAQSSTADSKKPRPPRNPNAIRVTDIEYKAESDRSSQIVRPPLCLSLVGDENDPHRTWPIREIESGSGKKEIRMRLVPGVHGRLWESMCPVMFKSSFGALVSFPKHLEYQYITFLESEGKARYGPRWFRWYCQRSQTYVAQPLQWKAAEGYFPELSPPNPHLPARVFDVERYVIGPSHNIQVPQNQQFQQEQFPSAWPPATQPHPQQPLHNQMLPVQPSVEQFLPNQASSGQNPHNQVVPNLYPTHPLPQRPLPQPPAPQQLALVQGQAADQSGPDQDPNPFWDFTNGLQNIQHDPTIFEVTDDEILAVQQALEPIQ